MPKFFKYAGSKKAAAETIAIYMRTALESRPDAPVYFPFIGSGGLFWHMFDSGDFAGRDIVLNDANRYLTAAWRCMLDGGAFSEMIALLTTLFQRDAAQGRKAVHGEVRSYVRENPRPGRTSPRAAASFIYLCQTSYNGLWRVNSKGQMNTPPSKVKPLADLSHIRKASEALRRHDGTITVTRQLWANCFMSIPDGSVVYNDPPYHKSAHIAYVKGFAEWQHDGQVAFERECRYLVERACAVLSSNSLEAEPLWQPHWITRRVNTTRTIACKATSRGIKQELLAIGLR